MKATEMTGQEAALRPLPDTKPELLAPAGDMERLRLAVLYGADAVYLAGTTFGMRSFAGNFSDGLGYLANPLIPHAEKESPCGEVSKNDLIELADGQTVLIKGNRQEII